MSCPVKAINVAPAPAISTGGFDWEPVDPKIGPRLSNLSIHEQNLGSSPKPSAPVHPPIAISIPQVTATQTPRLPIQPGDAPLLTKEDGNVLSFLQYRTFVGTGFNNIFRPRSKKPLTPAVPGDGDNVLELNLTTETLTFTGSLGDVPNRGFGDQADLILKGLSYVQKVNDVTNPATGQADGKPIGIHFEPGVWLAVPSTTIPPNQGPTLARMASIPHGATINAQANQPNIQKPIAGSQLIGGIPKVDITPFLITDPNQLKPKPNQQFNSPNVDRLPVDISKFDNKQVDLPALLKDPNVFLRRSLTDQSAEGVNVENFFVFTITTQPTPVLGGGTDNIAFLGGNSTSQLQGGTNQNAFVPTMNATFWIETMTAHLPLKGNLPEQKFMPAGPLGPTFYVGPTFGLHDMPLPVTWTQVQYSQEVVLNFNTLGWPHRSVATLAENTVFDVQLHPKN